MAKKLCVIEVIVKYVIDGKSFTVSLDPMQVGSIFFDEKDKNAAIAAQNPTPVENLLTAAAAIPPKVGAARTFARTVAKGRSKRTSGPALWWHTNECNWFHPGD